MAEYIEREALLENMTTTQLPRDAQHLYLAMRGMVRNAPSTDVVEIPKSGIGDLSDGYHTFNELYHHRAVLFSVICNAMPDKAWKSKLHDTGDMFDGMFIVGVETPHGQATYHYDINPYWDMFNVKELEKAPKWDGHTPQDAIERIKTLSTDQVQTTKTSSLPCSIGDIAYFVLEDDVPANEWFLSAEKVTGIAVNGFLVSGWTNDPNDASELVPWQDIGVDVFFSEKEARKVLQERNSKIKNKAEQK